MRREEEARRKAYNSLMDEEEASYESRPRKNSKTSPQRYRQQNSESQTGLGSLVVGGKISPASSAAKAAVKVPPASERERSLKVGSEKRLTPRTASNLEDQSPRGGAFLTIVKNETPLQRRRRLEGRGTSMGMQSGGGKTAAKVTSETARDEALREAREEMSVKSSAQEASGLEETTLETTAPVSEAAVENDEITAIHVERRGAYLQKEKEDRNQAEAAMASAMEEAEEAAAPVVVDNTKKVIPKGKTGIGASLVCGPKKPLKFAPEKDTTAIVAESTASQASTVVMDDEYDATKKSTRILTTDNSAVNYTQISETPELVFGVKETALQRRRRLKRECAQRKIDANAARNNNDDSKSTRRHTTARITSDSKEEKMEEATEENFTSKGPSLEKMAARRSEKAAGSEDSVKIETPRRGARREGGMAGEMQRTEMRVARQEQSVVPKLEISKAMPVDAVTADADMAESKRIEKEAEEATHAKSEAVKKAKEELKAEKDNEDYKKAMEKKAEKQAEKQAENEAYKKAMAKKTEVRAEVQAVKPPQKKIAAQLRAEVKAGAHTSKARDAVIVSVRERYASTNEVSTTNADSYASLVPLNPATVQFATVSAHMGTDTSFSPEAWDREPAVVKKCAFYTDGDKKPLANRSKSPMIPKLQLSDIGPNGRQAISELSPRRGGLMEMGLSMVTPRRALRLEGALNSMALPKGDTVRMMSSGVVVRHPSRGRYHGDNPQLFIPPECSLHGVNGGDIDSHYASWKV